MDELSIKVTIANRQYPLKINRADEERVRKAAKILNDRIKDYEEQYAVNDKFDLVAMCAMQFASELVNLQDEGDNRTSETAELIASIDRIVTEGIRKTSVH
jgi:cell division protein ZapA (FtsZ GTPase activity inhibitor)